MASGNGDRGSRSRPQLTPWTATVNAGEARDVAEWTGMARDGAHAAAIAVALTSAAWKIRTGGRAGAELTATHRKAHSAAASSTLTIQHEDLLRREAGLNGIPRGAPRDSTLEKVSDATLRLTAGDMDPSAHGMLEAALSRVASQRGARGETILEKHQTDLTLRAMRFAPSSRVTAPDALTTAIAAVSLAGGRSMLHSWSIEIPPSATLRAAFHRDLALTRQADAGTVAHFLKRMGLGDEAEAVLRMVREARPEDPPGRGITEGDWGRPPKKERSA